MENLNPTPMPLTKIQSANPLLFWGLSINPLHSISACVTSRAFVVAHEPKHFKTFRDSQQWPSEYGRSEDRKDAQPRATLSWVFFCQHADVRPGYRFRCFPKRHATASLSTDHAKSTASPALVRGKTQSFKSPAGALVLLFSFFFFGVSRRSSFLSGGSFSFLCLSVFLLSGVCATC